MILYDFDYERPRSLQEAVALLAAAGDAGRALAGGTDLLPNMRIEVARPSVVVSLAGIAAETPCRLADGSLRVDALSRLADLVDDPDVREAAPMLAESVHTVASNQVRQAGTLGGNLCQETRCLYFNQCHDFQFVADCYKRGGDCCYPFPGNDRDTCWSVYMSDVAPALIALDAQLEIVWSGGVRRLPVADLFTGDGLRPLSLDASELVSAVIVPPTPDRFGWGYHKSTVRGGLEFGMAVMAATLRLADDGATCAEARLAFSAIDQGPVRAPQAEALLAGQPLTDEVLSRAAQTASEELKPLPHHGFSKRHLRDNIRVYLGRILHTAADRARA